MSVRALPDEIRDQYGFRFTARDARAADRAATWLRRARRHAPAVVARWPEARQAPR